MRWLHRDLANPAETQHYNDTLQKIDAWWQAFTRHAADLDGAFSRSSDFDIPAFVAQHLQVIDNRICWEFGPARRGDGHRLVITPECHHFLRPMLDTLLERAPKIPGWEFYPYRPPESLDMAKQTVEVRVNTSLDATHVAVAIGIGNRIDLTYLTPNRQPSDAERHGVFVATETLVGEEALDKWIGGVNVQPLPKTGLFRRTSVPAGAVPLDRLKPTVDALITSIRDQLPPKPYGTFTDDDLDNKAASWHRPEPPEPQEDYAAFDDAITATIKFPDLWQAQRTPGFAPERFTTRNETFCYLKIEGDTRDVEARGQLEDAIHAVLNEHQLGGITAGGMGLRYLYIDLALTDLPRALPLLRHLLQNKNIAPRSWLLFFEPALAHEWLGIYPHTPAPPEPPTK